MILCTATLPGIKGYLTLILSYCKDENESGWNSKQWSLNFSFHRAYNSYYFLQVLNWYWSFRKVYLYLLVKKVFLTIIFSEKSDPQIVKLLVLRCQCICHSSLFSISDYKRVILIYGPHLFFTHLLPAFSLLSLLALSKNPYFAPSVVWHGLSGYVTSPLICHLPS